MTALAAIGGFVVGFVACLIVTCWALGNMMLPKEPRKGRRK